jgi:hypothetical protein|tara:strand:- start:663 stop:992 length:330 start_codon:yes stop_codon:yes gene_type:complete
MKRTLCLIVILISFLFESCSILQPVLSAEDKALFALKGDEVLYDGKVVGVFGPMEYEYSNGKFQQEISVVQKSFYYDDMTVKIAHFLAIRFPKSKIEVKVPRDDQMDRF